MMMSDMHTFSVHCSIYFSDKYPDEWIHVIVDAVSSDDARKHVIEKYKDRDIKLNGIISIINVNMLK
jgi:hypothetical protein